MLLMLSGAPSPYDRTPRLIRTESIITYLHNDKNIQQIDILNVLISRSIADIALRLVLHSQSPRLLVLGWSVFTSSALPLGTRVYAGPAFLHGCRTRVSRSASKHATRVWLIHAFSPDTRFLQTRDACMAHTRVFLARSQTRDAVPRCCRCTRVDRTCVSRHALGVPMRVSRARGDPGVG